MYEHPKGISLCIPENEQKTHYKINSLGVAHAWKMIRYLLKHSLEKSSSFLLEFESTIEVFLNLLKTGVFALFKIFAIFW